MADNNSEHKSKVRMLEHPNRLAFPNWSEIKKTILGSYDPSTEKSTG